MLACTHCLNCFVLNSGHAIPAVGLGTSRLGTMEEDVVRAIKDAVDVGYRHFDTAALYAILFLFSSFLKPKTFSPLATSTKRPSARRWRSYEFRAR